MANRLEDKIRDLLAHHLEMLGDGLSLVEKEHELSNPSGTGGRMDILARDNQQVAAKVEKGEPITAPGVPKTYPDAKKLVTEDCIKPSA